MPAGWLYKVGPSGVLVTPKFMERLRSGDGAALRSLNQQKLTLLYRKGFTRESRRPDAEGLFWSSTPSMFLIPFIRAGRHSPQAWVKDGLLAQTLKPKRNTLYPPKALERARRSVIRHAKSVSDKMKDGDQTVLVKATASSAEAWYMKPNTKFDLIVVNRHDRAALLKLLSELDTTSNVDTWLAARTDRGGATLSKILHADYTAWCAARNEMPTGVKSFAQALVAAGVHKLTRSKEGERYELTLR